MNSRLFRSSNQQQSQNRLPTEYHRRIRCLPVDITPPITIWRYRTDHNIVDLYKWRFEEEMSLALPPRLLLLLAVCMAFKWNYPQQHVNLQTLSMLKYSPRHIFAITARLCRWGLCWLGYQLQVIGLRSLYLTGGYFKQFYWAYQSPVGDLHYCVRSGRFIILPTKW